MRFFRRGPPLASSLVMRLAGASLLWALPLCAIGCHSKSGDVDAAEERWSARHPASYAYRLSEGGDIPGQVIAVIVRDGQTVSEIVEGSPYGSADGFYPYALFPTNGATVEGLFDSVRRGIDHGDDVEVTYDADLGFPTKASFSNDGEGDWFALTDFHPLDPVPNACPSVPSNGVPAGACAPAADGPCTYTTLVCSTPVKQVCDCSSGTWRCAELPVADDGGAPRAGGCGG